MSSNQAIDFHDDIAADFDQKYESSAAFRERFKVWTDLFRRYVKPTDQVIDLGCGSGIFSNYLGTKGCQVIGIDGSAAMIHLCNSKKTSANVHYVRQSLPLIDSVPYHNQDIVLMSSLLEYIADAEEIIRQVNDLLRPSGLFIVSIPNETSIYRRVERILFRLIKRPRYVAHLRNRSTEIRFRQQLTASGFDVLERVYFSNHDPISRILKPFLTDQYVNNLFVVVCRKRGRSG
ncbi:class I SAM-dependent methyltransferase [Spirosoma validum]|uniref:Class I SAM-dependent methyltransferase n=1 Tax=Spirosoma validum TaxID=2771355 RepID=A0A927GBD4_9BACT|nr:class I SAM-dependent methyltransferase [Spirosoma validum]MBD2751375.1 class I SAM-dependent methyltransferase [Spirosoma validum]